MFVQGATLQYNDETGALEIARILLGGAADRSGKNDFFSVDFNWIYN